jgi:hypothetical protein
MCKATPANPVMGPVLVTSNEERAALRKRFDDEIAANAKLNIRPTTQLNAEQEECGRRWGHSWRSDGSDYVCQHCLTFGQPAKQPSLSIESATSVFAN